MNLSPRWVAALEAASFDAVHWTAQGPPNAPDAEIMRYAIENNFVVLTKISTLAQSLLPQRPINPVLCKSEPTIRTQTRSALTSSEP